MGTNVDKTRFSDADYAEFAKRLDEETATLLEWAREGRFAESPIHVGEEVEGCLINDNYQPEAINRRFLAELKDPCVTEEFAGFNIEFNPPPQVLQPGFVNGFRKVTLMQKAFNIAEKMRVRLFFAGILPTAGPGDLSARMMSRGERYEAVLNRFAEWLGDDFCTININENDGLRLGVRTILMEAVTTSHQVHLQVAEPESAAYYNTSQVLAGPLLAMCCNSPYFLGCHLWEETRVPLFEQIVSLRFRPPGHEPQDFFGSGYVDRSLLELFVANRDDFAVLLPNRMEGDGLPHLALHNGTIWRWNRPVIGADADGNPTLRIEHRAFPSGPTNDDMCANLAVLVGATLGLYKQRLAGTHGADVERLLPFASARENFYACARDGLAAEVAWFDGKRLPVRELLANEILPLARRTFAEMNMTDSDMEYLSIAEKRVENGNTGAQWQRDFMAEFGGGSAGLRKLTAAYWRRQTQGLPVHLWTI